MASVGITVGDFRTSRKAYKASRKGMREMMRSEFIYRRLLESALDIAEELNREQVGHYDVGPIGEGVYSKIGAHAFVRTADHKARIEQAYHDTLGSAVGG